MHLCRGAVCVVCEQVVPIVIPNLQALQLSQGFGISMEFSLNEDWRYHNDDDDSHNLPLESSTRLQLGLGAAMSGVELLAANRLRAWGFQQLAKIFEDVRVGTVTARLVVAALTSCVAHRWMSFCHPPWAPQPPR